jgi:hypothetical protein
MTDLPEFERENLLISKLLAAGIDAQKLASANEAARMLRAQTGPVEGSCLSPRHQLDFQRLFEQLVRENRV